MRPRPTWRRHGALSAPTPTPEGKNSGSERQEERMSKRPDARCYHQDPPKMDSSHCGKSKDRDRDRDRDRDSDATRQPRGDARNYYDAIWVDRTASKAQINKQIKAWRKLLHADKNVGCSKERAALLNKIYLFYNIVAEVLLDDDKRRAYDALLPALEDTCPHGDLWGDDNKVLTAIKIRCMF
jgi:hypothetical protein